MKKILSILLVLAISLGVMASALAAATMVVDSKPAYKTLLIDVAVEGIGQHEFYASVDGSDLLPISYEPIDAELIGHIVVVDLAWTWTTTINEDYVLIPAIQDYLSQLDSKNMVKFVFAGSGGAKSSAYMSVAEGYSYIENNLKCVTGAAGTISKTAIDAALKTAFTDAVQYREGDPLFKTVFALVDPANPGKGMTATNVRNSYLKEGNSFPVLIATINPVTYIAEKRAATKEIEDGIKFYSQFAQSNDAQFDVLEFSFVPNTTFSAGYNVAESIMNRSYYTLDITPIHPYIDYTKKTNEISIYVADSRGNREEAVKYEVQNNALPTALPTPTPTPTPIVTVSPTPTPEPYVVKEGDSTAEAKKAIKRLKDLYYLDVEEKDLPKEFDSKCAYALMDFCDANDFPYDGNISIEIYNFLMSDEVMPKLTPTPEPIVTVTPTATPTAVPAIYTGATGTSVLRAIKKLQELYYLESGTKYEKWTDECMLAFQELCEANGIAYSEDYLDDNMYEILIEDKSLVPKVTPTPTPEPAVSSKPTIPPEGFKPGYKDTPDSNFVASMQIVLQNLNLYASDKQVGVLDQPTLEAIELYCTEYGLVLSPDRQYVERNIILDILENGANRKAYTPPEPSTSEQFAQFLHKDVLMLGEFQVKMWMLLSLIIVLLFVIMLIIILSRKKPEKRNEHSMSVSMGGRGSAGAASYASNPYTHSSASYGGSSFGDDDATRPQSHAVGGADDDATVKLGSGINVTLNISGGVSSGVQRVLIGSKSFIIGRTSRNGRECDLALDGDISVSRKHAALYYQDKQLYIRNLSTNGTCVNGQQLSDQMSSAVSDETVPLSAGPRGNAAGFALKRGDIIEISGYRITVNW